MRQHLRSKQFSLGGGPMLNETIRVLAEILILFWLIRFIWTQLSL